MFKNIKYFLPTYGQCWTIVFYTCIIGGIGIGGALSIAAAAAGMKLIDINPVIMYILPLVPAFLYVVYKGNETEKWNKTALERGLSDKIQPAVPLNNPFFGRIPLAVFILLTTLATFFLIVVTEPLSSWIPMPEMLKQIFAQMLEDPFWNTLSVVIAAPLIEEFFLRGIMLRGMLRYMSPVKAILWSAFFFALIHMNLFQALNAFLCGLFIGWIYYKTRSLWICIFIHFVNNGLAVLLSLLFPEIDIDATLLDIVQQYWGVQTYILIYVVSAAGLTAILYYFNKAIPPANK